MGAERTGIDELMKVSISSVGSSKSSQMRLQVRNLQQRQNGGLQLSPNGGGLRTGNHQAMLLVEDGIALEMGGGSQLQIIRKPA